MNKIQRFGARVLTRLFRFKHVGYKSYVYHPMQINNPSSISIGRNVGIFHYAWLMGPNKGKGELYIGDRTTIGHFAHIVSYRKVIIEEDVLIADRVFISDCTHSYENVEVSVQDQEIRILNPVCIGKGSWIGENVCICGANIGKHSVVGANSVVLKDIPDFCVAAGNPAKVIKRYDFEHKMWIKE